MEFKIQNVEEEKPNALGHYIQNISQDIYQTEQAVNKEDIEYIKPTFNLAPKEQIIRPTSTASRRCSRGNNEIKVKFSSEEPVILVRPVSRKQSIIDIDSISDKRPDSRSKDMTIEKSSCKDSVIVVQSIKQNSSSSENSLEEESLCFHCQKQTHSKTERYSSAIQCGWCVTLGLMACWPVCWIPFMVKQCDLKVHKCQECNRRKSREDPSCFPCLNN